MVTEPATFIAKDVIAIVPLLIVALMHWPAVAASASVCYRLRLSAQLLSHAAADSYPSDHGTTIYTFALAFLF